jgi:hypothetical protein
LETTSAVHWAADLLLGGAMSLVHNEQTKLLANALDRASTACLTVGILAPIAAAVYTSSGIFPNPVVVVAGVASWTTAAFVLHMTARRVLRRLL